MEVTQTFQRILTVILSMFVFFTMYCYAHSFKSIFIYKLFQGNYFMANMAYAIYGVKLNACDISTNTCHHSKSHVFRNYYCMIGLIAYQNDINQHKDRRAMMHILVKKCMQIIILDNKIPIIHAQKHFYIFKLFALYISGKEHNKLIHLSVLYFI